MRYRVALQLGTLIIVILITWAVSSNLFDVSRTAMNILGMDYLENGEPITPAPKIKCDLSKDCPVGNFAIRIASGAANVVGPRICFEGQIVMSHIHNNVGPGLNIVVINGETGAVDKFGFLNSNTGRSEDILAYLKQIEPRKIVLLASFDDVTPKLTDEIKDVLESMGSTLIKTLKSKDNWVFAGVAGGNLKSPFEKVSVNKPGENMYDEWPKVVEISGCFPKNSPQT